jgi:hypothetical protein
MHCVNYSGENTTPGAFSRVEEAKKYKDKMDNLITQVKVNKIHKSII